MDEEPSTSRGIKRSIPKQLQDEVDVIAEKHPRLTDSHNVEIELWKEQEVMFVETPVVEEISQILESEHSVLIVGEPGIGKSMLMHHIALKLHSTMNYIVIPCSAIKDIIYHYKEDTKQMFVLDDMCGLLTASFGEIDYLQKYGKTLKKLLEKGKTKITAACRLDIYCDENVNASGTVFTSNIFNLSDKYSKENKLTICTKYLTETNIQLLKDENKEFTPLMCYLYSKNENFNLTDFLHCPYETYKNEWDKLKSIDPYKYCALFLCVLHNGIVKKSLFDIYSENSSSKNLVLKNIFEICGLSRRTTGYKMETVFDTITGTYVRKTSTEYRVIHDQMFDFMCNYFGNKDTMVRCILRYACIEVLNERTQLESINEQRRKFTILITNKYDQEYFERIQNELQFGNMKECARNPQMNHNKYRASFIKVLKSIDDKLLFEEIHPGTLSKKYNKSFSEFLISSCSRGYYDIVKFYITKDADLENSNLFNTPLTAACEGGHENIVQLLIDKGYDVNQADGMGYSPLIAACKGGNEKIVQLLIDKGCNVHYADGMGLKPLIAACKERNEKIVLLLLDKGCNVNQADDTGQTPLTAACEGGNEKMVRLLIYHGCDVNQSDGKGLTPLKTAWRNENIKKILIEKGYDDDQIDDEKIPVEIRKMDQQSIEIYLRALKSGSEFKMDINLVIVGKKGAGKTALVRKLFGKKLTNLQSTNGIDIHRRQCKIKNDEWIRIRDKDKEDGFNNRLMDLVIQHSRKNDTHNNLQLYSPVMLQSPKENSNTAKRMDKRETII